MKNEFIRMRLLLMFINGVILDNARGGTRTTATSKMERFVIIVNGWLTIIQRPASYIPLPLYILLFFYSVLF